MFVSYGGRENFCTAAEMLWLEKSYHRLSRDIRQLEVRPNGLQVFNRIPPRTGVWTYFAEYLL